MIKFKLFLNKDIINPITSFIQWFSCEFRAFLSFFNIYVKDKTLLFSNSFENNKNFVVKTILLKRGKSNRIFLHLSAMGVLTFGVIISPLIHDSNALYQAKDMTSFAQATNVEESIVSQDVFQTTASEKPRDTIITYTVQKGDTLSIIAKRFGISEDTIKWANDMKSDNITVGDELKILPVTGMAHKVERGDTVYSIAKKYQANAQAIADFPFNDFANPQTFSLIEGQIVFVPDGIKPAEKPRYVRPTYIVTAGPVAVGAGGFAWPISGGISQFYSWYHKGIDITNPVGTPIVAAQTGTVSQANTSGWNYGYGINMVISGDNGYSTLYAHMSGLNVGAGDRVIAGKTVIGWVGMSGRTTGPHLHFEIMSGGGYANPLSVLQ